MTLFCKTILSMIFFLDKKMIKCTNELYNDEYFEEVVNYNNYTICNVPNDWKEKGFVMTEPENKFFLFKKSIKNLDELFNIIKYHEDLFENKSFSISLINNKEKFLKLLNFTSKELLNSQVTTEIQPEEYTIVPKNVVESPEYLTLNETNDLTESSKSLNDLNFYFMMICISLAVILFLYLIFYVMKEACKRRRARLNVVNQENIRNDTFINIPLNKAREN